MIMSDSTLQQMNTDAATARPGQLLRAERERRELTQKEIAAQMNLQVTTIDALENDAAEHLPAATFVRGYIRSYAKIVNLDGDALVKLYDGDNATPPPEIVPEIKTHTQVSSNDKPVKAMTYLVTFGLVLLLIAWLQSQYVVDKNSGTENMAVTGQEMEEFEELPPPTAASQPAGTPDYPETPYNAGLILEIQEPLPEIPETIDGTIELPDTSELTVSGAEAPNLAPTTGRVSNITQGTSSEETPEPPLAAGDELQLKLVQESWIEVYDSGNNRLYLGLARPGEKIRLSGIAPFNVLLGYAPGVEVRFNGKSFDPQPHSHAGIARFKLGEQENQARTE